MSINSINNDHHRIFDIIELNFSDFVVPFSSVIKKLTPSDIYTGLENIPFKEKDPEFKKILMTEFLLTPSLRD